MILLKRLNITNQLKKFKADLLKRTDYNAKIKDIEDKIPSVPRLATTAALTSVEKKIPNFIDLVKKADYDAKISEIETKYFTASDYNSFMTKTRDAKITQESFLMNLIQMKR